MHVFPDKSVTRSLRKSAILSTDKSARLSISRWVFFKFLDNSELFETEQKKCQTQKLSDFFF